MNCYKCDTLIENNWNYCPNCKRKIKKHATINVANFVSTNEEGKCSKCSCVMDGNWNFCPICGTSANFESVAPVIIPVVANSTDKQVRENLGMENSNEQQNKVMYCSSCGNQIKESHLFCASCGSPVNRESNNQKNGSYVTVENNEGYAIWLVTAFLSPVVSIFLAQIYEPFLYLGAGLSLFSIIYAKSKYPNVKAVKIVFWIYMSIFIICAVVMCVFLIYVIYACGSCLVGLRNCG